MELIKDSAVSVLYHPCKSNVVDDSLRRLCMVNASHVEEDKKQLAKDVHRLAHLRVRLLIPGKVGYW